MITVESLSQPQSVTSMESGPLAENAASLIAASRSMDEGPLASTLRAWCVARLFQAMESVFSDEEDPIAGINLALAQQAAFFRSATENGVDRLQVRGVGASNVSDRYGDVKDVTGNHYGHLFKEFSAKSYWDEPAKLLRQRLERNGIAISDIRHKSVLDAGCGGGRYSVAWRMLGACPVTGVDISPVNIADAEGRVAASDIDSVSFKHGDVLNLPVDDDEFDIVFSNGVLHHTSDWRRGVQELLRAMKPSGLGWLYLIENPGGLFWDVIEILRVVMREESRDSARAALQLLGIPGNRVFYMLDHVMVPINLRLTPDEIEDCLKSSGARNIRRLTRGASFDRVEQIYQGARHATTKYGVGENRYVFSK